ncbi:unnamed protein product [Blepharisma stoltei]|uniref:Uncharacterized protein n=1 Tax=Blepharisma stoltei TaxID=1481888 RepID=A0AAU9IWX6_9CILI|nr:unnamed protein product [Blepharisma stoltei]
MTRQFLVLSKMNLKFIIRKNTYNKLEMDPKQIDGEDLKQRLSEILEYQSLKPPASDPVINSTLNSQLENHMDAHLNNLMRKNSEEIKESPPSPGNQKKRGRKPLRPNDPIKKKTEEKDKYWLRVFRAHMKSQYSKIKPRLTKEDQLFWLEYLGSEGKPGKGNKFLSYGKRYKNFLFSHPTFVAYFRDWFTNHGQDDLSKKTQQGSDLWYVYYDYASKDLFNYIPHGSSSIDGQDSPLSCTSPPEPQEEVLPDPVDFCMIDPNDETYFESFINQM